ncbi:MAG TPA: hypothetical protein VFV87_18715 [Pirellulaceae bacterium]|nr:hypothetical protein [Pirellulaceae bacterium]
MKVIFIAAARQELQSAIVHYNAQRPTLGDECKEEVDAPIDRIEFWPNAWSQAPPNARVCKTKRFPYGIVYLVDPEIIIIAKAHLHRCQGYWKKRLKDLGP